MLDAEDDLSFTHALHALAENIPLLYNDDAVNSLADALFYAQMAAWNAGTNAALAEANHTTATIRSARKCKAKNPARCKYHKKLPTLLDDHAAFKHFCRRRIIKDKQNREIIFGSKLYEHFYKHHDKHRKDRAKYLLFAEDTVASGTPSIDTTNGRRIYEKNYKTSSSEFLLKVVCVPYSIKGKQEVLTFYPYKK